MAGPIASLRVVVLARTLPLDIASMILADLGGDVVMVEDPDHAAPLDAAPPMREGIGHRRVAFNRNKRSLGLSLADESGREALGRLFEWADVVLFDSSESAVAATVAGRLREVAQRRPELVTCDAAPWGTFGPRAGDWANDLLLQAAAGCMDVTGEPDDPPTRAGVPVIDFATGTYVAIAVIAASVARQRSGRGSQVSVAGYDTAVAMLSNMASAYFATGEYKSRLGTGHISIFPYNAFKTSDGEIVIAIFTQAFWSKFCIGIGRPDLVDNPRYKSIPDRMANKEELAAILDALFLERTTEEWSAILEEADVPYGPVLRVGQALSLDQTVEREMTPDLVGSVGPLKTVGSPMSFLYSDGQRFRPTVRLAPRVGADDLDVVLSGGSSQTAAGVGA